MPEAADERRVRQRRDAERAQAAPQTTPQTTPRSRPTPDPRVSQLFERVTSRMAEMAGHSISGFVASDLPTIYGALERIAREGMARGPVFCEWGSGLGAATALAALLDYEACGIEIEHDLVGAARELVSELNIEARFAAGSFLLPGDDDLIFDERYAQPVMSHEAYSELDLTPAELDVVFSYPWPGEEALVDRLFLRHSTPDALLLTFHGDDRILVQRHVADNPELVPLGWM
ncbi:MAG: hypothetical protein DHS20C15_19380 [Planctomycetota bacterium]|nr:MAG: hypothetical protein DHS20C15_19380 [Planctomycetota bacterium]